MPLSFEQRGVLKGIVPALMIALLVLGAVLWIPTGLQPPAADVASRLIHVAAWDLLVVVWLVIAIGALARHRFFHAEDIDGGGLTAGSTSAKVHQSVLQNTLEQVVLAVLVHGACAVLLPVGWLAVIPAAAVLFALGRFFFWRGYRHGAAARALGFGLTFYPTVMLLLLVLVDLLPVS